MPGAGLLSPATRVSAPRFKSRTVPVLGPHCLTRDLSECFGIERLSINHARIGAVINYQQSVTLLYDPV